MVGIDVYFPKHVDEQTALSITASLLPGDANQAGVFDGVNVGGSTKPDGSCRQIVYTSTTLAGAVSETNPTWTRDPQKASLDLYSGHASTDAGDADKAYRPESINEVMVGIQGENRGTDGVVHC
jgi:hypothetical protein